MDGVGCQGFQLDRAKARLKMCADGSLIAVYGTGLYTTKVFGLPNIQPLADGQLAGGGVGAGIYGGGDLLQFFGNLFLGLTGDGALDLLSGSGVIACSIASLPKGVFLPVPGDGFLTDCAGAGSCFFCHFVLAFPGKLCYHKRAVFPYRGWWVGFLRCPFPG